VYIVPPMMQIRKTSIHSPPEMPLRGIGFDITAANRISINLSPPQAISTNGQ